MKNALILHGLKGSSKENWFSWLGSELENKKIKTFVPDLPEAESPDVRIWNEHILSKGFEFNEESIIIGHSSGAVAALGILQELPDIVQIDTCYLVSAFKDDLGWDELKRLFSYQFDFEKIKTKAKKFIFLHSDNDPYCPLEHVRYLHQKIGGELIIQPNQKHFSIGTAGEKYKDFPFLLDFILSGSYKIMIGHFLGQYQLMSLATYGDHPWIANVYYAFDSELNIYFLSNPQSQHCQDIQENSQVALAVLDSTQTPIKSETFTKAGVQLYGEAVELTEVDQIKDALEKWKRSLNISSNEHFSVEKMMSNEILGKMFKVIPKKIKMFDEELFKEGEVPTLYL